VILSPLPCRHPPALQLQQEVSTYSQEAAVYKQQLHHMQQEASAKMNDQVRRRRRAGGRAGGPQQTLHTAHACPAAPAPT
jgi:hypothetical protein